MTESQTDIIEAAAAGVESLAPRRPRTVLQPRSGWSGLDLREIWSFRDLLAMLVMREVRLRYSQAALGIAWVLLQPLLAATIFYVIFGVFAKMPSGDAGYLLFVFSGLVAWTFFSGAVQRGSNSLVSNAQLITKIYFPRLLLPLAHTLAVLLDFAVMLAVLGVLILIQQEPLTMRMAAMPLFVLLMILTATGVALWLSALSVKYRDFVYVIPFMIQVWMFASPVIYAAEAIIPEKWRWVYYLNPAAGFIEGFRWSVLSKAELSMTAVWETCAVGLLLFLSGAFFFRRVERGFADTI